MRILSICLFLMVATSCVSNGSLNPYYIKHHEKTETLLEKSKFRTALNKDREMLRSQGEGGNAMRRIYLESKQFQEEFKLKLLQEIASAASKEAIEPLIREFKSLERLGVLKPKTELDLEETLNTVVSEGNKSGRFRFSLVDKREFSPFLYRPSDARIIYQRTINMLSDETDHRDELMRSIANFLRYNKDDKDKIGFLFEKVRYIRLAPEEYRKHFAEILPSLGEKLNESKSVSLYINKLQNDETFRTYLHSAVRKSSYYLEVKANKDARFVANVNINNLDKTSQTEVGVERTPMPRMGSSAISRIIMAAKDIGGHTYTLVHNETVTRIFVDFDINLCVTESRNKECTQVVGSHVFKKVLCDNPRLWRPDGGVVKQLNHYPITSVANRCLQGKKTDLDDEIYSFLADAVAAALVEFDSVKRAIRNATQ